MAQEQYNPQPEDLEHVRLPKSLNRLIDALAKNVHEVWAKKRMDEGWKYGVERNDKLKTHPGLVNYEDLTEEEKDYDRNTALSTLKFITKMGYKISTEKKSHCRFQNIWKRVVHWKPMRLLDRTLQGGIGKQLRILGLVVLGVYTIFFILAFFLANLRNGIWIQSRNQFLQLSQSYNRNKMRINVVRCYGLFTIILLIQVTRSMFMG